MRNLEVKQVTAEEELQRDRARAAAGPAAGDHALLPPDGGVRARRHPDHRSARGRRGRLEQQALPPDPRGRSREQIKNGVPFSDALAEHAKIFPPYYIGILRSAELTGQLDVVARAARRATSSATSTRKSKIKAAMIYPMVIVGMSIITVVILVGVGAAEVRRVLQGPRRRSCRCRRGC